eukprot:Clim_evm49s99 gene=Clim_evmTU49s99
MTTMALPHDDSSQKYLEEDVDSNHGYVHRGQKNLRLQKRYIVAAGALAVLIIISLAIALGVVASKNSDSSDGSSGDANAQAIEARPDWDNLAERAKWVVDNSMYAVISFDKANITIDDKPLAFGTVESMSSVDGKPVFYMSELSTTYVDMQATGTKNGTITLTEEMMLGGVCTALGLDVEDPLCTKLWLVGTFRDADETETDSFKEQLFTDHPIMATWPSGHDWHVMTMDIAYISIIDYYGGMFNVSLDDYFD